jgi:aspartate ammonia-lyase
MSKTTRKEHDCLGEMDVPDSLYYGIQTMRVQEISSISGIPVTIYPNMHKCLARIKKAAARANAAIGTLDEEIAGAICWAADEVLKGGYWDQFPLDIYQGGGYTCVNMNMNEVLSHLANEKLTGHKGHDRVHPNTHVNMGQSTNDVIPSATRLSVAPAIDALLPPLRDLARALRDKQSEFADVVKVGRTCLQDAVPMTLGQEFGGYATVVERQIKLIEVIRKDCFEIIVGASAVGTGIGSFPGYQEAFYRFLSEELGEPVWRTADLFDGMQNDDFYVQVSGLVKQTACAVSKIAKDFRILSSGPRAGFGEITIPSLSPGSSIMPGKINPIAPELVSLVAQQTCGNDLVITMGFEQGELEINVWMSTLYKNLFESFSLLTKMLPVFTEKCVKGVKANREQCSRHAHQTLALSTVVAATLGYEEGVRVSIHAASKNLSVREAVLDLGIMTEKEADLLLDPILLTDPDKMANALDTWRKQKISSGNAE